MTRKSIQTAETLPGMPHLPFAPLDLSAPINLAKLLTPAYGGIDPNDYAAVTPDVMELAAPAQLRRGLIDVSGRRKGAGLYLPQGPAQHSFHVALTSAELDLTDGSIETLGRRVENRIRESWDAKGQRPTEEDKVRAVRGGVHSVETVEQKITRHLDNVIAPDKKLLWGFRLAAQHPERRMGDEGTARMRMTELRTRVFGDMFSVLRHQLNWADQEEDQIRLAVDKRIYLDRADNRHIDNFAGMVALLDEWNGYRRTILLQKRGQARRYITQHGPGA